MESCVKGIEGRMSRERKGEDTGWLVVRNIRVEGGDCRRSHVKHVLLDCRAEGWVSLRKGRGGTGLYNCIASSRLSTVNILNRHAG